jgi:hypothetical protein
MKIYELTAEEASVYNSLPVGHKNAIKRDALARRLGVGDREMREIIENLNGKRYTVCNFMDGQGYFIPGTEDEFLAYEKIINSYKCKFQRKEHHIKKARQEKYGLSRADVRTDGKRRGKRFAKSEGA